MTRPPSSRLTTWERRSSHAALTDADMTVNAQAGDDKNKQQDEISPPDDREKQNGASDVSSVSVALPKQHGFCSALLSRFV